MIIKPIGSFTPTLSRFEIENNTLSLLSLTEVHHSSKAFAYDRKISGPPFLGVIFVSSSFRPFDDFEVFQV